MPDKILPTQLGRSQNLTSQINIDKIEPRGKPQGFYKSIVLEAVGIVLAFFVGYAYFEFLGGSWPFLAPIGAILLFVVTLALEALLINKAWRRTGVIVVEIVALLIPFYAFDVRLLAICAVIGVIFFIAGYLQSRSEIDHSTTIRFFRSTHGAAAKTVTAALLIGILLYLPMASAGKVFVDESEFNGFFNWAAGLANDFYPKISFTGSFGNFAQSVAKEGFASNTVFEAMSPDDQNAALAAASNQLESNLSASFGVKISPASPMSDVAYNAIKKILQGWSERFSLWFTAGWAIGLFLVLRSVGVVAVWAGQFLTMIAYESLLSLGVIRIVEEPQTKEVIEF